MGHSQLLLFGNLGTFVHYMLCEAILFGAYAREIKYLALEINYKDV